MSTTAAMWLPGLIVLVVGIAGGLWMALRLRKSAVPARTLGIRDLELRIADLEERRDELYARLRGQRDEVVDSREALALERSAARVLRELDQVRDQLAELDPKMKSRDQAKAKKAKAAAAPTTVPAATRPVFRHPMLVGFLFGSGMVALVALLVVWAIQDAQPGQRGAPAPQASAAPAAGDDAHGNGDLPPEAQAHIAELESRIAAGDGLARKELAVFLLEAGQLFPAFQHSQEILRSNPSDPDGLYVSGVVRLQMGQMPTAIDQFDQVLAQYPDHVLALGWRGWALMAMNRKDDAIASWERAVTASGGSNPEIEELLADARAGALDHIVEQASQMGMDGSTPSGSVPPGHPPTASTGAGQPAAAPAAAGGPYRVLLEVAPGIDIPEGATLFVFLEGGSFGAPTAVKRVTDPSFPVEIEIDAGDSMMGDALPASGMINARLDTDGDLGTQSPDEAWARAEGRSGQLTKLVMTNQ